MMFVVIPRKFSLREGNAEPGEAVGEIGGDVGGETGGALCLRFTLPILQEKRHVGDADVEMAMI